ncbi:zinc-binding alcohol dehydrogenase [Methylothermus subterraneus]
MKALALFHTAPRRVEAREVTLAAPGAGQVLVKSWYSAVSPGTEKRIFAGELPQDLPLDATLPALSGSFGYPFRYGYALIGEVAAAGPGAEAWLGKRVFLFHPHQSHAVVAASECLPVPEDIADEDALFFANLESAVSFVHDAAPRLGERVLVVGLGVVGLLTVAILARFPVALYACDPIAERRRLAQNLGALTFDPDRPPEGDFDLAIELSGSAAGLQSAIDLTGVSGRIVLASWYRGKVTLDLGGAFHRSRIRLLASQVSRIDPELSGRWDKARRHTLVWERLRDIRPGRLVSHRFPLEAAQEVFERLERAELLQPVFVYGSEIGSGGLQACTD